MSGHHWNVRPQELKERLVAVADVVQRRATHLRKLHTARTAFHDEVELHARNLAQAAEEALIQLRSGHLTGLLREVGTGQLFEIPHYVWHDSNGSLLTFLQLGRERLPLQLLDINPAFYDDRFLDDVLLSARPAELWVLSSVEKGNVKRSVSLDDLTDWFNSLSEEAQSRRIRALLDVAKLRFRGMYVPEKLLRAIQRRAGLTNKGGRPKNQS
ncbi:hypothetical protein [Sphingomonas sp.]|uniref:hypothetical protein n=1 Tax=Sphingomonas sp. TaxID=28214 RepID=UPI003CC68EED